MNPTYNVKTRSLLSQDRLFTQSVVENITTVAAAQASNTKDRIKHGENFRSAEEDGGSLLHRIPWPTGKVYCERNFDKAHVVFDGYDESTTTFVTHQQRSHGKIGVDASFTDHRWHESITEESLIIVQ